MICCICINRYFPVDENPPAENFRKIRKFLFLKGDSLKPSFEILFLEFCEISMQLENEKGFFKYILEYHQLK